VPRTVPWTGKEEENTVDKEGSEVISKKEGDKDSEARSTGKIIIKTKEYLRKVLIWRGNRLQGWKGNYDL